MLGEAEGSFLGVTSWEQSHRVLLRYLQGRPVTPSFQSHTPESSTLPMETKSSQLLPKIFSATTALVGRLVLALLCVAEVPAFLKPATVHAPDAGALS